MKPDLQIVDQNQVTLKDGNHGKIANENCKEDVNSLLTIKKGSSPKDLQTSEASLKDSSKDGFEKKEAIMKPDLQIVDQNQVTLKDSDHGKKANEHCKEDVNSLLTIKNDVSPKDSQVSVKKEVSLKEEVPEDTTLKDRGTDQRLDPQKDDPKIEDTTLKDEGTDQMSSGRCKEETDQQSDLHHTQKIESKKKDSSGYTHLSDYF